MTSVEDIVDDIWLHIIDKYLDIKTKICLSRVSKRFNSLVRQSFDSKTSLLMTDDSPLVVGATDEDLNRWTTVSVKKLCEERDGIWLRSERGLRLLTPIQIQELVLRNYRRVTALCLVITRRSHNACKPIEMAINCCGPHLKKLIIINTSSDRLVITMSQMKTFCQTFPNLEHFELFSKFLFASEEVFGHLLSRSQSLHTFKLNAKYISFERISLDPNGGQNITSESYFFSGSALSQMSVPMRAIEGSHSVLTIPSIISLMSNPLIKDIKHLGIENVVPNVMQRISECVPNLESLSIAMSNDLTRNQTKEVMRSVGRLSQLQRLSIIWFGRYEFVNEMALIDSQSVSPLKDCHRLTHLTITEAIVMDSSLRAIHENVPHLRSLELIDCKISETTFLSIPVFRLMTDLFVSKSISNSDCIRLEFAVKSMANLSEEIITQCLNYNLIDRPPEVKPIVEEPHEMAQNVHQYEMVISSDLRLNLNYFPDNVDLESHLLNFEDD